MYFNVSCMSVFKVKTLVTDFTLSKVKHVDGTPATVVYHCQTQWYVYLLLGPTVGETVLIIATKIRMSKV